ncbi:MAG: 16S rRNA (uracil(1498)-N(3))-methyltransferase [Bacteroidales bacterium]|nr:16S rRNA (uracil(1498)-N(3))-methyltransferase [Bacteroidales bacterium]
MELFYSRDIDGNICRLDPDESGHCVRVLRHRCGDEISVIDGCGSLYRCRITSDSHKGVEAMVLSREENWGGHGYNLHLAVCPTKNNDRYEWFAEKACEMGFDRLTPVIGDHSERRILKTARVEKILVSATKQSLKAAVPAVDEPISVKDFILSFGSPSSRSDQLSSPNDQLSFRPSEASGEISSPLRLIAYCFEDENIPRRSIKDVLSEYDGKDIIVLIGPEGDFSHEEARLALQSGFIPVHLGNSRLRTETAAITAAAAVYFRYM